MTLDALVDALPENVAAYFSALPANVAASFSALDNSDIPALNDFSSPESFPDRALVSFRAMVQDISASPEIYLARRPSNQPGGCELTGADDSTEVNYADLRECTVLWAVSVPGESPWCSHLQQNTAEQKPARPHKFPIPDAPHVGAQVKIYDSRLAEGIKASDICTFVGILTRELLHTEDLEEFADASETIPTLHVLHIRETASTIIPRSFPASFPSGAYQVRKELINWIANEALGGDTDAAEWILLSAVSKTQSRTPPIYPPSLTLSSFPPSTTSSTTPTLHHVLTQILPLFVALPLTLDTLNKTSFYPESKNEDLHSGWLQVPQGIVYLLNELGITEGKVLDRGIQNLRAVQGVMTGQTLDYAFPFSQFSFQTDISFVVLTEGKKCAFFQTSVNIPLKGIEGRNDDLYKPLDQIKFPSEETLNQWRSLVGGSRVGKVTVTDQTAEYIQNDFVKERKTTTTKSNGKEESAITSDDLVHRMITARLLALSYHEPFVTTEIWEETKALEARRKARI
ncbi:Mini-chromosome maintenance complex-binding protein [Leucoagaricus sp. SymC.cos]|nr:Mini-chromosome maintenance complex-binding protein [Leucoagaricus sp. SymC.cos]